MIIHAGAAGAQYDHVPAGTEYYLGENRGDARAFAHAVIDAGASVVVGSAGASVVVDSAGASVVVGSGPHVIRGVEDFHGHLITYSLGNFVGYHTLGGGGILDDSRILRVTLGAGGIAEAADRVPITLVDGLPRPGGDSPALVASRSAQDCLGDHFTIASSGVFTINHECREFGCCVQTPRGGSELTTTTLGVLALRYARPSVRAG